MTAAPSLTWTLPYRAHPTHPGPDDPRGQVAWALERLIYEYCDAADEWLIDIIGDAARRATGATSAQVFEMVERLCVQSEAVDTADHWREQDCAIVDYSDALDDLLHAVGAK